MDPKAYIDEIYVAYIHVGTAKAIVGVPIQPKANSFCFKLDKPERNL